MAHLVRSAWWGAVVLALAAPLAGQEIETTHTLPSSLTTSDQVLRVAATAAQVGDWLTTLDLAHRRPSSMYEKNPILGRNPSEGRVNAYCASVVLLTAFAVPHVHNPTLRRGLWLVALSAGLYSIHNNRSFGLSLRLP